MRLQSALDNDLLVVVERLLANGVSAKTPQLYAALQRSNSSLKRKQKKVIEASLERVLDFLAVDQGGSDSEAAIDVDSQIHLPETDIMNRSLRANLAPPLTSPPAVISDELANGQQRKTNGESLSKRRKTDKAALEPPKNLSLRDIGGMDHEIAQLEKLIVTPMQSPELYAELRLPPPKGVLLHGPPGCGKTMLCRAFAAAIGKPFIEILGPSIVSGMSGESEKGIRDKFEEARRNAPCLVFIDEIDAIAPKRDSSQSQMEKRIVAQLLVSMDELHKDSSKPVIVLAATNRPDSIDPALRRGGRFGSEINISVPDEAMRQRIMEVQTREMPLANDVDFGRLAKLTAGFVGADLHDLIGKAGYNQVDKYRDVMKQQAIDLTDLDVDMYGANGVQIAPAVLSVEMYIARTNRHDLPRPAGFERLAITMDDFTTVLPTITPSSKREGFATIPDVSWKDIGALDAIREELESAIVQPIQRPELYEHFGGAVPTGVLLWGPPGCGKTLLAKAVAAESRANFISIKGPELLNKFVGESEAAVRKVFTRARSSVPCVIFFDELDALVPKRDSAGSEASARVVNTLLTEMDGLSVRSGIYIVAATNRPDMIDDAMLRPGRLDTPLFVDLPETEERVDILRALVRDRHCDFTPDIADVARGCKNFSGADLGSLVQRAVKHAIKCGKSTLDAEAFTAAAKQVHGSVQDIERYRRLRRTFGNR